MKKNFEIGFSDGTETPTLECKHCGSQDEDALNLLSEEKEWICDNCLYPKLPDCEECPILMRGGNEKLYITKPRLNCTYCMTTAHLIQILAT